jgi:hypothetical protein
MQKTVSSFSMIIKNCILCLLFKGGSSFMSNTLNNNINMFKNFMVSAPSVMPPADLTPAVDKFVRVPSHPRTSSDIYFMTAKGPSPNGPDPFSLVYDELKPLSDYVKELVLSENPVLTMAASHFFEQVCLT